jgi:hypothetical protein
MMMMNNQNYSTNANQNQMMGGMSGLGNNMNNNMGGGLNMGNDWNSSAQGS